MWITAALPILITAVSVQLMPEKIAMHYNAAGKADRLGSKYESFILPVIIVLMAAFWEYLAYRLKKKVGRGDDERAKAHADSNAKVIDIIALCTTAMLALMQLAFVIRSVKGLEYSDMNELSITSALMGILFILLGNIMPKTKPNGSVGLRIKWSMYNDITWQKSNLFAGKALMAAGAVSFITALLVKGAVSVILLLVYLFAALIISSIYAKKIYNEQKNGEP